MKELLKIILYKPLFNVLVFLTWLVPGHNIGLAIIILTILIRLVLIPSSNKAIHAQKKIKDLNPQIEELKKKYPDKQEQAKKMMEFYKINKINPLSSCLPLLIQLPILFILYYVFRTGLTTDRYEELLYSFTPHVAQINTQFLWVNLLNTDKLFILPIAAGLLQYIQSKQMAPVGKSNAPKSDMQEIMQKQMLYILPFTTVLIAASLPAALSLYWVASILITIIQQKIVMSREDSGPGEVKVQIRQKHS